MGVAYNSSIVTSGLVLALDAANPKNYNLTAVEVLVVAGGGSGGVDNGGGGGAGGLIYNQNFAVTPGSPLTVTVGAGGVARAGSSDDGPGNNGDNSIFGSLTAYGGGGGSGWTNTTLPSGSSAYTGGNGAGQSASTSTGNSLGAGTGNRVTGTNTVAAGQGNNGGTAVGGFAGGGGGAGGTGGNASNGAAGAGGLGVRNSISGTSAVYAAGGAGGWDVLSGYSSVLPFTENGTVKKTTQTAEDSPPANTGHGGNGGNHNNNSSGAGGSGIVIVRYQGPQRAIGGTITSNNGYTIHTFITNGNFTFTPLVATNNSAVLGLSDFSGRNNFATANGPTYSSANGGSIAFDGSNDYVDTGKTATQLGVYDADYTFDAWVYPTNLDSGSDKTMFGTDQTAARQGLHLVFRSGAIYQGHFGDDFSAGSATLNAWNNISYTYIKSSGSASIYKNGVLQGSGTIGSFIGTTNILLGRWGTQYPFMGNGSNYKIYNRALSAAEVSQNFNALKSRYI